MAAVKLLADECCEADLVARIRAAGHDVVYVAETMAGANDEDVLHRAFDEWRILLTEDKDFGELVVRLRRPARGIILLRFDEGENEVKERRLLGLLGHHGDRLGDALAVLDAERGRLRPLPKT